MKRQIVMGILLLAGCSTATGSDTVGSLGEQEPAGRGCLSLRQDDGTHHFVTSGWEVVKNTASTPVTITDVQVTDPHGVTITDSRVVAVPKGSYTLIGNVIGHQYSADAQQWLGESWPAIGGRIAAGEQVNLILFLRTHGGQMGPVRIAYADVDGDTHLWTGGTDWSFMPNCLKNDGYRDVGP
ncbi:MAG: hypothetical protein H0V07_11110 [Propionibacteriales bacterium]|nr:hypothetical protein [Propionibacteriales bacterium]